jgi:hypothetical protein
MRAFLLAPVALVALLAVPLFVVGLMPAVLFGGWKMIPEQSGRHTIFARKADMSRKRVNETAEF